ncbi:MAG TPA: phosphoadenylyl-sulfate reductase [Acidiphilium sp.]|nr:MAG: phosphoadenosine phosphosulfate reductase [Acidiphilium sp. 21-60-14]OYV89659.1 MAG: phosphoadenosine phosphosulfate reductase [Acidiphilium sp. 37-60-79]OZB40852.1 MAG: phosphoadenosine phosphosulfate reductase [Acidiphilium sp. 34-60-192]HQT88557.1 phosphoadenylyl-sulfate reductase [Acidiphilium sp.]HQU24374.1 phosphoadenylyl-sulfate reductase [Acidiphilium sp.]
MQPTLAPTPATTHATAHALLTRAITQDFPGQIALISSFGTESAVLLHLLSTIDRAVPVLFLDTGKLFPDSIAYRDALTTRLRLTNIQSLRPDPAHLRRFDPDHRLAASDPDLCCAIRKTMPLDAALTLYAAWITGRKRTQSDTRATITAAEPSPDGRTIFNPLHDWTRADIEHYFRAHALPRHPLEAEGFASIGCVPCTRRIMPGESPRAGRWSGTPKTECGIFLPRPTQPIQASA